MKKKENTGIKTGIIIATLAVLVFAGTVFVLQKMTGGKLSTTLTNSSNNSGQPSSLDNSTADDKVIPDGATGTTTDLIGTTTDLIPSARSIRSLEGLLVQVNQVDACKAPQMDVYANLTDDQGKPFPSVRKQDFTLSEDGAAVNEFSFSQLNREEVPLAVTLVIDMSGSMKGEPIVKAREAAADFVQRLLGSDSVALVTFDDTVETRLAMTSDKNQAVTVINAIQTRGDTALYDAVAVGAQQAPRCGRSAVIVLSDGADTASKQFNLEKAINEANIKNTPTYVIGLKSGQFNPAILKSIAESTGAQYFEAPTPQDLTTVYDTITNQLRSQYRFSYQTQTTGGDHRVKIESSVAGADTSSEKSYRR